MSTMAVTRMLIKRLTEEKWDVYPVRCKAETEIGDKLLYKDVDAEEMRGRQVTVKWCNDKEPAIAALVKAGT